MASVHIFTAEIRVQFQGGHCVMLVDVHPKVDAVEPCKTVLKSMPNYTVSPLRRWQLFLPWDPPILQSAALVFPCQVSSHEYSIEYSRHNSDPITVAASFVYLTTVVVCCCTCGLVGWLGYFNKINKIQEMASDSFQIKECSYALLLNSKLLFSILHKSELWA